MTMSESIAVDQAPRRGNIADLAYEMFLGRVRNRFLSNIEHRSLFTTDAIGLWDAYLDSFPAETRQYHVCIACRRFIERFGGLVTIDETGAQAPAIWDIEDADADHGPAITAMSKLLRRAAVTGVFLSSERTWGQPETKQWIHLHLHQPEARVFKDPLLNADQAMAEKLENYRNVQRALEEFPAPAVAQALTIINSEALYRSDKVIGPARFLGKLHADIEAAKSRRSNIIWREIATAPSGFCHPRSSMIGTLLEDIISRKSFDDVSRRFAAKMDPRKYQHAQVAPSAGNIAQAEKVIAALGAEGSLARRFARVEEIDALWRPAPPETPAAPGSVFGHITPKGDAPPPSMSIPAQTMTWEKFARTVLPTAKAIDLLVPHSGNFSGILTAVHPDAPPILRWDSPDRRNPFSWYLYPNGSPASNWALASGAWVPVTAITRQPSSWFGGLFTHQGDGALLVLKGARDLTAVGGLALFPENLKSEFHAIRSTIEAYSKAGNLAGREEASACGIKLEKGSADFRAHVRVTDSAGVRLEFKLDRWD